MQSFTDPAENIGSYRPWCLRRGGEERELRLEALQPHGRAWIARLDGIDDRDSAAALTGMEVVVDRACLPQPDDGHYYWTDLLGLRVVTTGGEDLGRVEELLETGANDVLVVTNGRRRLIPFLPDRVIRDVDQQGGRILVDWDPEF